MKIVKARKFTGHWPVTLVVTGVVCSLFITGALLGIPLIVAGIYMATARETIQHCPNCGHYFKVRRDL